VGKKVDLTKCKIAFVLYTHTHTHTHMPILIVCVYLSTYTPYMISFLFILEIADH